MRQAKQVLLDQGYAARLAREGDPRGVLRALNEYQTLTTFGWAALYGDTLVPAAYVARTHLIERAQADAQREQMDNQSGQGGSSYGQSGTYERSTPGGRERAHVAVTDTPRRRKSALDQAG